MRAASPGAAHERALTMAVDLIAAVATGLALAGCILAASNLFGLKVPRYVYPFTIGAGMIGISVYLDYTWYGRTREQLPPRVAVVEHGRTQAYWQPWTLVAAPVNRFIAVDPATARRNEAVPDIVLTQLIHVRRRSPTVLANEFVDCAAPRRASANDSVRFAPDGTPEAADWVPLPRDHPLVSALCERDGPG